MKQGDSVEWGGQRWLFWAPELWYREVKLPGGRYSTVWASPERATTLEAFWEQANPAPTALF